MEGLVDSKHSIRLNDKWLDILRPEERDPVVDVPVSHLPDMPDRDALAQINQTDLPPQRHSLRTPVMAASTLARSSSASLLSRVNSSYKPSSFSVKSSSFSSTAALPV